jgi:glycosyltransferase involved in cell wall biosynthesis
MPSISVVMAVYNGERYLAAAVESVLAQTYRDFEFLIVDDGSTDRSGAMLRDYAARAPRVRLIARPNKGLTKSLNEAIGLAQGEFVARMDADDVSMPERFEQQVRYLREHPDCVCVGSRVALIDPYGAVVQPVTDHKLTHDEIDAELLQGIGWAIVHPAAMIRRDALQRVDGYHEEFRTSQDLDLFLRLAEIGRLANLPEPLVQYRQHFESVNYARHEEQTRVKGRIVADAYRRRELPIDGEPKLVHRTALPASEQLMHWAWAALKNGNATVARKHAIRVLGRRPWSLDSWRVMYCAMRGY